MFKKDILVKELIPDSLAETVDCQIYFVNINYHSKPLDIYLYRICRDFQAVEKGDFHHLQTAIIRNVLEYYQNEGGKEETMKEIDRIRETEYYRGEEKGKEEGKEEGKKEGKKEGRKEVLLNMCKDPRFTDLDIANVGGISVSEVVALRQRLSEAK